MKRLFLLVLLTAFQINQANARDLPVPPTISPQLQTLISLPAPRHALAPPANVQEWKKLIAESNKIGAQNVAKLLSKLDITVTPAKMAGVPVYIITPNELPAANKDRVLLNFHGGGYVFGGGEAGLKEAILMAALAKFKVIYVDYRMPPDFPFPAAIDDAIAVYRELLKATPPEKIGVFGTSTGGGLTLALPIAARREGLPFPGALAAGTPWTDLTKTGDSYVTNEYVDNILASYDGWLGEAARLYANGHDLKDPLISPVYGDVGGFPPTMLTTGTRDLFLSNTARMHLKLREAGVPADLIVFEAMPHAQYMADPDMPETKFHFKEVGRFFDKYLK